jgi:iron(III) transport system ATP-binding protein
VVGVTLEHIRKSFGTTVAVDDVSLDVERGELFFLLGPSGSGKTTLLRVIAGFAQPEEGRVFFDNRDVTDLPPNERNTGMVFQSYALWPHMTVAQNVAYGLEVRGTAKQERDRCVMAALEIVRMGPLAGRSPNQLSGGQQQRVALARALVIEPDCVLLDEPLSNLDAKLRLEMREEISRIHRTTGMTMIYVTHDQKEALSLAGRIAVLGETARVEQIGTPRGVYHRPVNRFVAGFMGEVNFLEGTVSGREGNCLTVQTDTCPVTASVFPEDVAPRSKVTCAVRPEAIEVNTRPVPARLNQCRARLVQRTFLGETEHLSLKLENDAVLLVSRPNPGLDSVLELDEVVDLTFDPTDVVVFVD